MLSERPGASGSHKGGSPHQSGDSVDSGSVDSSDKGEASKHEGQDSCPIDCQEQDSDKESSEDVHDITSATTTRSQLSVYRIAIPEKNESLWYPSKASRGSSSSQTVRE